MQKIWETHRRELQFLACLTGLFLVFQYLLTYIAPFVLAYLLCEAVSPAIEKIQKKIPLPEYSIGFFLLLGGLSILGVLSYYLVITFITQIIDSMEQICQICKTWQNDFCGLCHLLEQKFGAQPDSIYRWFSMQPVPKQGSFLQKGIAEIMTKSISCIKPMGTLVTVLFVSIIASCLLLRETRKPWMIACHQYADKLVSFLKAYLCAQLKIVMVITGICLIGYSLAKVTSPLLWAAVTALLDMLPFIGTGIVVLPLILWRFSERQYQAILILVMTYGLCVLARQFLEPKLLAKSFGISPFFMLAGIYIGIRIFGLSGIVLGPVYIMISSVIYHKIYGSHA